MDLLPIPQLPFSTSQILSSLSSSIPDPIRPFLVMSYPYPYEVDRSGWNSSSSGAAFEVVQAEGGSANVAVGSIAESSTQASGSSSRTRRRDWWFSSPASSSSLIASGTKRRARRQEREAREAAGLSQEEDQEDGYAIQTGRMRGQVQQQRHFVVPPSSAHPHVPSSSINNTLPTLPSTNSHSNSSLPSSSTSSSLLPTPNSGYVYHKGPLDICLVITCAIAFTLGREVVMRLCGAFGRWWLYGSVRGFGGRQSGEAGGKGRGKKRRKEKSEGEGSDADEKDEKCVRAKGKGNGNAKVKVKINENGVKSFSSSSDGSDSEITPSAQSISSTRNTTPTSIRSRRPGPERVSSSSLITPTCSTNTTSTRPSRSPSITKSPSDSTGAQSSPSKKYQKHQKGKEVLSRREVWRRNRLITRFSEQGWSFTYCAVYWSFGVYILSQAPCFPFRSSYLWGSYPDYPLQPMTKFYYLSQLGFWFHQLLILQIEEKRKDHWQMFAHHIITIGLVGGSYWTNFTKIGVVIHCLMDFADILLPLAKMFRYLGLPTLTDATFVLFLVSWLITRQIGFFALWLSTCFRATTILPMFWDPANGNYSSWTVLRTFQVLLGALQVMSCIWFYMACNVAYRVVRGLHAEDSRSDDEGDAPDDSEEDQISMTESDANGKPIADLLSADNSSLPNGVSEILLQGGCPSKSKNGHIDASQQSRGTDASQRSSPSHDRPADFVSTDASEDSPSLTTAKPSVLAASLASAKSLIALQLLSRLVTFSLNQALVRLASPTVFGTAAVQFDLIRDSLLFLSREAVRGVVTRLPDGNNSTGRASGSSKDVGRTAQQLRHLLLLPALVGLMLMCTALPLYTKTLPHHVTSQSSFFPSLSLYVLSTLIELGVVEPISLYAQYLSGDTARGVQVRVKAEGTAVIVRAVGTVAWLAIGQYGSGRKSGSGARDGKALLGFAAGQLAYAVVLAGVHLKAYWQDQRAWRILSPGEELSSTSSTSASYLDPSSRDLVVALSGQSLVKHMLTTGDMIVVARTSPLEDQGGYAVASNYASLVARIVFQPVEESSRLYFAKSFTGTTESTPTSTFIPPFSLLACLIRTSFFLLLLTPTFVPPLLPILLPYMLPAKYLATSAPRALYAYLTVYLPIMALNGILEAFFAATTSVNGLMGQSGAMVACSGVFAGAIAMLSSVRNDRTGAIWPSVVRQSVPDPESGLVYANAVQMLCRIGFAGYHAWALASVKLGQPIGAVVRNRLDLLPRKKTLLAVAVSAAVVRGLESALPWTEQIAMRAIVVGLSGAAGLACLGAFYLDEKNDWRAIGGKGKATTTKEER